MEETFDFQYKLSGSSKSSRPGSHKSSERGSGMEFNRLVSLQQYPDPRRLDLRASIIDPYERWLVREFKQRSAVSVFAIVDLSASVRFHGLQNGKNLITKILTSVMNSVRRYGDRFGLIGFDNKLPESIRTYLMFGQLKNVPLEITSVCDASAIPATPPLIPVYLKSRVDKFVFEKVIGKFIDPKLVA